MRLIEEALVERPTGVIGNARWQALRERIYAMAHPKQPNPREPPVSSRLKDGSPRKPSERQLVHAIDRARSFFAVNADMDTSDGMIADEILGPLLRAYEDLVVENERLRRDVQKLMRRK